MSNETLTTPEVTKQEVPASGAERIQARKAYIPRTDIYELNDEIMLVADMPGVDENSVDITLEKDVLTLEGLVEPTNFEGYQLSYSEYGVGDYRRQFTLSNEIDRDRIEATVKNGVLTLRLPKANFAKTKKISVKSL